MVAERDDLFTYYALSLGVTQQESPAAELVAVASADWNRDGQADLAVATRKASGVTLLLSQPGGSLLAAHRYEGGSALSALAVADLKGKSVWDRPPAEIWDVLGPRND
jgi:hypothetical protein